MGDPDSASLEANMEDHITASLGPMGRLLRRLHSFEASQHSLPEGLSVHEIQLLEEGLKVLYTYLKDAPAAEDPSCTPKWWIKEVRELGYDTEDYFDEVMNSGAGVRRSARLSTIFRIISKRKRRPQNAKDFSQLMVRVDDARERYESFKLAPIRPDSGQAGVSCLTPKLSLELPVSTASISVHVDTGGGRSIVGVEEPMNKLVNLLAFDNSKEKQLKVIPIFGSAGVGKTTLARTLYHKFGGKFQCRAFLRVSRNPDMRRLLTSMLSQIKAPRRRAHALSDAQDLIDTIIKHLEGKRYFIIIDDLWTASAWHIISRALPDGNCCSRIITTTQIDDVALACCGYQSEYLTKMEPFNDGESRKLFFNSVFGSEGEGGCPKYFEEVADGIIRKCGGLPLSIVNIASLLPSKPKLVMEQWENVQRSLPSTLRINPTSEGMKDVLILMYNNLPPHLKTCLLYLSMYPEGYTIRKDDLVKQWEAEGFIGDTEHVARGYFDELVRRGMIQPVDTNYNGEVLSCTVNHMVLDLIRYKSMEENFIIAVYYFESTPGLPDKVRRLSVQFGGAKSAKIPESIRMSQVRSLLFCGFFKCIPSIVDYRLLLVLILDIWADQDEASFDLTRICELFRLRYLKIECNITVDLPDKIKGLQHLRTLQIDARLSAVPSDIGHLEKLLNLRLPGEAKLPAGIGHMTSLRSLGYFNLSNGSRDNIVLGLGKLINLWDLRLTCSTGPSGLFMLSKMLALLCSILEKLSKLKSLILDAGASSLSISCDDLNSVSPAPALLERLELLPRICIFPCIPKWFGELRRLCILKIAVRELWKKDIHILEGLPALTALSLYVRITPTGGIVFGEEGFRALRYFKFTCTAPCLTFEKDAMPNVGRLKLRYNANGSEQYDPVHAGFEHLLGLKEISAKIESVGADEYDSIAALWMNVFSMLPSSPIFNMQWVDRIFNGDTEKSSSRNEENHQTTEIVQDASKYVIQDFAGEVTSKQAEADSETSVASGSSLQIKFLGEDESKATHTGSALEAPSSKHPSTPDNVNREFAESIIHDDKETSSTTKQEKHFTPEIKDVTSLRTGATSEISSPQPAAPLQTGATSEITSPQPEAPLQTGATSEITSHQPEAALQTSEERSDEQRGIEEKGPREDMNRQADSRASMPSGYIAHLQDSDCTLGYFDLGSNSEDNVMDLGKLTNLQDLHLTCPTVQPADNLENNMKCLGSILWKLSSLKCLALVPAEGSSHVNTLQDDAGASSMSISCDGLSSVSPAPALLERLELLPRICIFPSIPKWFGELRRLCILKIAVRELPKKDIHILEGLPALTALSLYVWTAPALWIIFDKGFGLLKYFKFMCTAPYMSFLEGAMPNVRKIKLGFNANRMKGHRPGTFGFRHLKGLREISIKFGGAGADESEKLAVYLSDLEAAVKHPINVKFVDRTFFGEQDKSSVTKGQEVQQRSDEDVNKELDSRISTKSESSSHMQNPEHKTVTVVTGDGTVSASTGAMYSVLRKLAALMGDEYPKLRGKKEVMSLKEELGAMNALLEQLADVPELNMQMKGLRNQMREMTYAVEDCMDDLMLQFHEDIHEATGYPEKWDMLQKLIHQIRDLRGRVGKADLPSMAHTTEIQTLPSSYKATESGLHTHYNKAIGLVGIDGPRDELVWRMNGVKRKLQVACILGSGGLGKTTLATEVYHHIEGPFDHRVFIEVPQKIDITRLHKIIIRQLSPQDEPGYRDINMVRRYLRDKRYLIVIDGVWSAQTWKVVKSALPNNNRGSRILMTTEVWDIAESCNKHSSDFIYFMQPLTARDSLSLLRSILFGSERSCPVELEKVAERILAVYGGIPMAIIIMAGILASIPAEVAEGVMVAKRMEPAGDGDPSKEMIRKMFDISYSSLPRDMKSCLLYLSVFRENYFGPIRNAEISYDFYRNFTGTNSIPSRFRKEFRFPNGAFVRKDRLIWRWIAEGFLPKRSEESSWETGERYFLELIARNLIEPVYEDDDNEVPVGCKVHGLILEFIASLSNEENFVTTSAEATHMQHDVIRRLTVSYSNQEDDRSLRLISSGHLSKLRSITILVDDQGENAPLLFSGPFLWGARFLRVLDLEDAKSLRDHHLMGIEGLVLLRYLGLGGTGISELPEEIGELEQLETLDLRRNRLRTLPASIVKLQKLVRLLVEPDVQLPRDIREMQELEEVSTVGAHSSSSLNLVAELLFKSKPLRMLDVIFPRAYGHDDDTTETDRMGVMSFLLRQVGDSNLQSLSLCCGRGGDDNLLRILLDSWEGPPRHLRRFKLELHIRGVIPPQMASLVNITHLDITITEVQAEGVRVLGDLPNLVLLKLTAGNSRRCVIRGEGFQCLKVFTFRCSFGEGLEFTPGAMPQLRRLRLCFSARESSYGDYDFGIQHLSCLTRIHATINCYHATISQVEAAEAAIRRQVSEFPFKPTIEFSRGHED